MLTKTLILIAYNPHFLWYIGPLFYYETSLFKSKKDHHFDDVKSRFYMYYIFDSI